MFCKQCGKELKEGAAFCTDCGAPVGKPRQEPDDPYDPDSQQEPENPYEPDSQQEPEDPYEPDDQQELDGQQAQTPADPVPPKPPKAPMDGKRKKLIIGCCVAAAVLALIAIAILLVSRISHTNAVNRQREALEQYAQEVELWLADAQQQEERLLLSQEDRVEYDQLLETVRQSLPAEVDWAGDEETEAVKAAVESRKAELEQLAQHLAEDSLRQVNDLTALVEASDLSWCTQSELEQVATLRTQAADLRDAGDYVGAKAALIQWQDIALAAQPLEDFTVSVRQYDLSDYPTVRLYVDVEDAGGNFISGLGSDAFYVNEGRSVAGPFDRRAVTRAAQINENTGLSLGLVADVSGSMNDMMGAAKQAMTRFVGTMQFAKGDEVELVEFASTSYICNSFTSDAGILSRNINAMSAGGQTRLYDTLINEIDRISSRSNAKCVIGFTDGYDNVSVHTAQDVIRTANASHVPVFLVGVGWGCDESSLRSIAQSTGGTYTNIDDISSLEGIYNSIYRQSKEVYLVEYTASEEGGFDGTCYLNIQARTADGRGGHADGFAFEPADFFTLMYNKFLVASMDCQNVDERNLLESGLITTDKTSFSDSKYIARQSQNSIDSGGTGSNNSNIFEVLTHFEVLQVQRDGDGFILYGLSKYDVSMEKKWSSMKKRDKERQAVEARYGGADFPDDTVFWVEENISNYEKMTLIRDTDGRWKFRTRLYEKPDGSYGYTLNEVYQVIPR